MAAQQEFLMTVGFRGSATVNLDARGKGNTKKKSGGLALSSTEKKVKITIFYTNHVFKSVR